jgi:uncharacterized membrane protein YphA (DoxX/SURF4 family)
MKTNLTTIGRIIFALAVAFFGIGHLMNANAMTGVVPGFLSGMALPLVYLTGICLLAAAVSFLINRYTFYAGILLAVFLILVILTVHVPGLSDEARSQLSIAMIVKDTAMVGAALMVAGMGRSRM